MVGNKEPKMTTVRILVEDYKFLLKHKDWKQHMPDVLHDIIQVVREKEKGERGRNNNND